MANHNIDINLTNKLNLKKKKNNNSPQEVEEAIIKENSSSIFEDKNKVEIHHNVMKKTTKNKNKINVEVPQNVEVTNHEENNEGNEKVIENNSTSSSIENEINTLEVNDNEGEEVTTSSHPTFEEVYKLLKSKEKNKVHVVATPQMPSLLDTTPESIKRYDASSRAWLATYRDTPILRESWPLMVKSRIDIEWRGSNQEQLFGSDWKDVNKVSEEIFLTFLRQKFVRKEEIQEERKSVFERFSEKLSKPIIIELDNSELFVEQYAELHANFEELKHLGIRPEWEKEQVKIALKWIYSI